MPKERNFNPVQAQRKADKAKAVKKGKAAVQSQRNERLAKRNPDRIQKEIDDLKAIVEGGGKLSKHEEQVLEALERDLRVVKKAREALGDKAPVFGRGGPRQDGEGRGGVLGKRRRGADDASSSDSDVPEDVKNIPMPRDTPPPIPKEILDEWYAKRRSRRNANTNANLEPLGGGKERFQRETSEKSPVPVVEAKTVYEAKPMVRDLRKEAVSAFVPTTVRLKLDKGKGQGGLLEPEEADNLEREGYMKASGGVGEVGEVEVSTSSNAQVGEQRGPRAVMMEEVEDDEG
ncbi:putative ww domain binding protein 11 protein [Phialemonium atrogriseum]|uniref:Ww domain binding protein 11 protein n=1 Tax=Phialemonium atrogriseum TaxID=1093897 RepID=A0AAJ0C472_9PEZI|nr:putative ww domain binding protein 11 protein [Phialemonium atrogriseum]KAK1768798.1 putative ww domain binding protein 11 protein [Phialemonium atrogriseum]